VTRSRRKKVFEKVEGCVKQANDDGFDYVWIDTCWQVESLVSLMPSSNIASTWIKASSAELSEAINTMYQWYKDSGACYVFLPDAPTKWDVISRSDSTFDLKRFFKERRQGLKICPLFTGDFRYPYARSSTAKLEKAFFRLQQEILNATGGTCRFSPGICGVGRNLCSIYRQPVVDPPRAGYQSLDKQPRFGYSILCNPLAEPP